MKILIASRAFDKMAGGVERMAIALMNEMAGRGHSITLLSWDGAQAESFYPLDPRITWHKIDTGDPYVKAPWCARWVRAWRVRRIVRQLRPDVMIAFQQGMFLALRCFTLGLGIPVVAAERSARFDVLTRGRYNHFIFLLFLMARRITIQLDSYRTQYPAYLRSRIVTIPNPVSAGVCQAAPDASAPVMRLLCVGRFTYQKNQMALLRAFSGLAGDFPAWHLRLVGEGEDRAVLEAAVRQLGLSSRVEMPGATARVAEEYCASHLFCLPSRWEGFPNALAEAMAHGLPAVGFRGCAGVSDLIEDGRTGWLAEGNDNADSLAAVLRQAMKEDAGRAVLGQAGRAAMRAYEPSAIFDRWEALFRAVAGRPRN